MPRMSTGDFMQEKPGQLMPATKRRVVGAGVDSNISQLDDRDRISNLPEDLIHCILKCLPVHDAARTSVLSKEWRYTWGMNTRLVLDYVFFFRLTANMDKDAHQSAFSRAVDMILSSHVGCISRFVLCIPPKLDQCPVALWIEILSKKGIRYLTLENSADKAYEIPSCLFDYQELIALHLDSWILNAPHTCTGFANLIEVELKNVTINADISFGTQLRCLTIEFCTGIHHLHSHFANGNRLRDVFISLVKNEHIHWRWLKRTSQLRVLGIEFTSVSNFNRKKPINIIKFLRRFPDIHAFFTTGFTLEVFRRSLAKTNWLATKVENLKELLLNQIGSHTSFQFSYALDLIRCFPNLQRLRIMLVDDMSINHETLTRNLNSIDWKDVSLERLRTVETEGVVCSNYVFHFVKILLASSPSLKVMTLFCSNKVTDPGEKLEIEQELLNFPTRSLEAEIVLWC